MSQTFWVKSAGKVNGPVTSDQLRQLAAQGKLPDDAEISANKREWHPKDRVKGLASPTPSTSRPATSAPLPPIRPDAAAQPTPAPASGRSRRKLSMTAIIVAASAAFLLVVAFAAWSWMASNRSIECQWWVLSLKGDALPVPENMKSESDLAFVVVKAKVPHSYLEISNAGMSVNMAPEQFKLHGVRETAVHAHGRGTDNWVGTGGLVFVFGASTLTKDSAIEDPFSVKPLFAVPKSAVESGNMSFQSNDSPLVPLTAENRVAADPDD